MEAQLAGLSPMLHRVLLVELEYLLALRRAELRWTRALTDDITSGVLSWDLAALLSGAVAPADPSTETEEPMT